MRETRTQVARDYHERATVFRVFAVETILPEIREELFMLADGFEQLAADQLSAEGGSSGER